MSEKKYVTIVYEIIDDLLWGGGGNPLKYRPPGLVARRAYTDDIVVADSRAAHGSEVPTPRTTELRRELYRLKSNTLEYPCEVQLTELCRELERENILLCDFINREMKMTAADPRISELVKRIAGIPNDTLANRPSIWEAAKPSTECPECDVIGNANCSESGHHEKYAPCPCCKQPLTIESTGAGKFHARCAVKTCASHIAAIGRMDCTVEDAVENLLEVLERKRDW